MLMFKEDVHIDGFQNRYLGLLGSGVSLGPLRPTLDEGLRSRDQ